MNSSSLIILLVASLSAASVARADSVVVFNELMYHPTSGDGAGGEWVELHNQMAIDIDLSRWRLEGGVEFAFPEGTIMSPGGYLVVAQDPTKIAGALGPMKGRLSNQGERLRLINAGERLMNELDYGTKAPWPEVADGSGASLAKWNIDGGSDEAENWTWSAQVGGTPGAANFATIARPNQRVSFNEVSSANGLYSLELRNRTAEAINLEGWIVRGPASEWKIKGLSLPGNGYEQITDSAQPKFQAGDHVFLLNAEGTQVLDSVRLEDRAKARRESDGRWLYPAQTTPKAANAFALADSIVINEIMYAYRPDYEVIGEFGAAETTAVDAEWRYRDLGAPEADWYSRSHPNWAKGKGLLGFAASIDGLPGIVNTNLAVGGSSYFFETEFTLPQNEASRISIRHVIDDGAVFYLNGHEVLRFNMPEGPITSTSRASTGIAAATFSPLVLLPSDKLVPGVNRLSVQVFQDKPDSDDLIFGVELQRQKVIREERPYKRNPEEWIELYNRGAQPVDLSEWSLTDAVDYAFPKGTSLAAGAYLIIAQDAAKLRAKFPGVTILGDWRGTLADRSDNIILLDAKGNPADEVRYYDSGRWPELPDGLGASLELRDPNANNSVGEAWTASDESARSSWQTYRFRGPLKRSAVGSDTQWREFVLGLLDPGEVWIDDLSLVEDPDGAKLQYIPTGSFTDAVVAGGGNKGWRFIGNHRHCQIIADPADASNKILRLVATGASEHMHNHVEISFAQVANTGREFELSFRAKYINGSPQLNTRVYFNRSPQTTILAYPDKIGTPGARNSRWEADMGPTYDDLRHSPVVPAANQEVTVSVLARHPKGNPDLTLRWALNPGASFNAIPMTRQADGRYEAKIPGQAAGAIVQFYIDGAVTGGVISATPLGGASSRALIQFEDGKAAKNGLRNVRLIMMDAETNFIHAEINLMSNDRIPCTVVVDEREVFYSVGAKLKGSERGRVTQPRLGYSVEFPSDHLYHGVHPTLSLDRSEGVGFGQQELLINQMFTHSGAVSAEYNDFAFLIAPRQQYTSTIEIQMARFGQHMLDSQFENGGDGWLYEYELIYYPTSANADGFKKPQPDNVVGTGLRNMGDFKEDYRWNFLLKNNRDRDDFRPIIRLGKLFALTGAAFNAQVADVIDVEQWCRGIAFSNISGAGDQYGANDQHNGVFYAKPDGKFIYFPHDLDFAYSSSRLITENNDLRKIIANPIYRRYYLSQLWDIVTYSYNREYMSRWSEQFRKFAPTQTWNAHLTFINTRSNSVKTQVTRAIPQVPFSISTNEGNDFEVATPTVELKGVGWLNVKDIKLVETGQLLDVTWLDSTIWSVTLPLATGPNTITLQALDYRGNVVQAGAEVGKDTVRISNTGPAAAALTANLAISELMYHPADPSASEKQAGFDDADLFEYIELWNLGASKIDLSQTRFANGISFAFAPGTELAAGQFGLLVRDRRAFVARYGDKLPILGEWGKQDSLNNAGERVTLKGAGGTIVRSFLYADRDPWPLDADGKGPSLELKNPTGDIEDPANWRLSKSGGTPGTGEEVAVSGFASWHASKFSSAELASTGISGPLADPDGDRFANLVEYALGGEPKASSPELAIRIAREEANITLEHPSNVAATDAELTVERSADLRTWAVATELTRQNAPAGRVKWSGPQAGAAHWRLKVRLK